MLIRRLLLVMGLIGFVHTTMAHQALADVGQIGAKLTVPLISQDPSHFHGYRGSIWFQPNCLTGSRVSLLFDAGAGHWWSNATSIGTRSLNIYTISPVVRFYLSKNNYISPFLDLSIGLAWLSETRLADRRFGMHFSFQDEASLGVALGASQRLFLSFSMLHYSNGSLAKTNAGITVPLLINLGYRF